MSMHKLLTQRSRFNWSVLGPDVSVFMKLSPGHFNLNQFPVAGYLEMMNLWSEDPVHWHSCISGIRTGGEIPATLLLGDVAPVYTPTRNTQQWLVRAPPPLTHFLKINKYFKKVSFTLIKLCGQKMKIREEITIFL